MHGPARCRGTHPLHDNGVRTRTEVPVDVEGLRLSERVRGGDHLHVTDPLSVYGDREASPAPRSVSRDREVEDIVTRPQVRGSRIRQGR